VRSCVATPVGQRAVWQYCNWMQPSANRTASELHQSAPSAKTGAMSKALTGAKLDTVAGNNADESVVHEIEPLAQRHAEVVNEFERRRPSCRRRP